jgi:hypothetical protein
LFPARFPKKKIKKNCYISLVNICLLLRFFSLDNPFFSQSVIYVSSTRTLFVWTLYGSHLLAYLFRMGLGTLILP